jgi:PAS domain S-box-containing protein
MPKKKTNNRLEKLFDEINKEPETQQAKGPATQAKKTPKRTATAIAESIAGKTPDPISQINISTENSSAFSDRGISVSTMLSTAFRTDEKNWATLKIVDEAEQRSWGVEEQMLVKQVADQLSLALENARLFQDSQRRAREMTALAEVGREISATLELQTVLERIALRAQEILAAVTTAVYVPDPEFKTLVAIAVIGEETDDIKNDPLLIGKGILGHIANTKIGEIVNDVTNDPRAITIQGTEDVLEEHLMAAPIMSQDTLNGLLVVWRVGSGEEFAITEFEFLQSLAQQAAIAVENARLFEETKRRSEELASLNEIIIAASQTLDTKSILEIVMKKVLDLTSFDGGLITMFNENRGKLERAIRVGMPGKSPDDPAEGLDGSLCDHVYKTGEVIVIRDIGTALPSGISAKGEIEAGLHGYLGIPIESKGRTLGTLCIFRYLNSAIPENIVGVTQAIGGQLGFTIENARLFEESRKFRLGLERSADAVFMTDIEGTIVYANPSFEKIYGFPLNEVIGKNPRIIKSGVIPQEQYKHFWETLLNKGTISGEILNKRKDGKLIPVEGTNSPILDENGNILGFLAIHSDITKRKEDEEALQRRNEYLAASAEIGRLVTSTLDLKTIFTRSVNLIVERFGFYYASIFTIEETGFNAILQEATGKAGKLLKERKHSLTVGSNSTVGKATDSGEVVAVNDVALDPIHKHNPLLPETKAEAAIPLKIGSRIIGALDIQSTEVNAFSEDDIAILQLLSDQIAVGIDNARSYNIAQQAVEEMREVDRLKSQFLANMSHELRTPLNSIIGFARVILKGIDGPITELQQQDLTAIFNSGQHLLGLINDILDLSRIEAGKMELTFDEVNMAELISSVMSTATGLIKDKPISLKREIPEDLPLVRADAMRVRQVLINFLSNASKFTEEGEIIVKAQVEESTKGQPVVTVEVTDTGPGIALEDQTKLFQPFSQVDASLTRKVGGSGLGLSICQHLIQMHGGHIGVHSDIGKGSTFFFSVPVFQTELETGGRDDNRVILAIDDDPQIISLYERYLEPKGFQVVGLTDPSKTRERAEQLKPFAITLDIMMPGYDGWQVLTDLKSSPETRDVPVIICSIVEDEDKGFSLGAADYLVKPILEEDLLNALDRLNGDGSIREVLVIDDDPNDLRLLGKMISEQGKYRAVLAEGGPAGWSTISSKPPHAIVLDLFMPELDGFTILERMRQDKKLRDIPVIVITGADLTADQHQQLENLGKRLLQKSSLKEQELIQTIENTLQRVKVN